MTITFQNVWVSYNHKTLALKSVNLKINSGEKLFIIGSSGVGKTTLLNCLTSKHIVTKGKILLNNQNILKMNKGDYKKTLRSFGLLSQISTCNEDVSVFTNIYKDMKTKFFFLKFLGVSTQNTTQKILGVLAKLKMFNQAFTQFKDLSGGQKQRVEIAKVIVNNNDLIIADEPTTSLDIKTAKQVIHDLVLSTTKTCLISVHNLELIPDKARVIALKNQRIILDKLRETLTKKDINLIYEN